MWETNPDYIRSLFPNISYSEFEYKFVINDVDVLRGVLANMPPKGAVLRKVDPNLPPIPEANEATNSNSGGNNGVVGAVTAFLNSANGFFGWLQAKENTIPTPAPAPPKSDSMSTIIYVVGGIALAIGLFFIFKKRG